MAKETKRHAADPASQANIAARRQKAAETKMADVTAREQLAAQAAAPGKHPNVLVVKRSEQAAKAEQDRLDVAAAAGAKQSPVPPPEPPPESGTLPPEFAPAHPVEPGPEGSAPFSLSTPAGPMGEDVIHVTDDIKPDGTPDVQPGEAPDLPEYDGEKDRTVKLRKVATEEPYDEPLINQHSEQGARLDALKTGREVIYVPNDATLDPIANKPERRD